MTFKAEIKTTVNGVETQIIMESKSPQQLLDALQEINGQKADVPTLEKLLVHLFERNAAYAHRNYIITIK